MQSYSKILQIRAADMNFRATEFRAQGQHAWGRDPGGSREKEQHGCETGRSLGQKRISSSLEYEANSSGLCAVGYCDQTPPRVSCVLIDVKQTKDKVHCQA